MKKGLPSRRKSLVVLGRERGPCSKEEAHEIACKYLGISINGESTGAAGTIIFDDTVVVAVPDETSVYYHVIYYSEDYYHHEEGWETRPPYATHLKGEVLVNATTGECFKTDQNILCEAVGSAAKYWGIKRWEAETHAGIKTVSSIRIADFPHCENPYYRVVLEREYYVCHEDGSADTTADDEKTMFSRPYSPISSMMFINESILLR